MSEHTLNVVYMNTKTRSIQTAEVHMQVDSASDRDAPAITRKIVDEIFGPVDHLTVYERGRHWAWYFTAGTWYYGVISFSFVVSMSETGADFFDHYEHALLSYHVNIKESTIERMNKKAGL